MKFLIGIILALNFSIADAKTKTLRRLDDLEARMEKAEQKIRELENKSSSSAETSGLKVKDYQNSKIHEKQRNIAGDFNSQRNQLSKEQEKAIKMQIEIIKKSQTDQERILNDIMNENN